MKILLFGVWLSFGSDAATTHYALNHGGREVLIPTQNAYVIDAVAAGEALFASRALNKLNKTHPKAAKILGIGMIAARSFVVYSNVNQLRKR
jgi:hypothetical protein